MDLKELSIVVMDCMKKCIDRNVKLEDVEIYISDGTYASRINNAQLRFSSVVEKHGILLLDSND